MLFDALMMCDGSYDGREGRSSMSYSTTSVVLADQVQEIALKLGYRARVRQDRPGTYGTNPVYRVLMVSDAGPVRIDRDVHVSRQRYTGKVWCVSVPNGVFVTRRGGVVAVQGNSC